MGSELTVSVVFTDLVGSTALASRLGPQRTEELRLQHFAVLREAVATSGGTEVKNLGDGLMVVYSSLGAALTGAVSMQQGIDRHNRKADEPLGIRIGVSTGDATEEDGDYFGEPVVEAARLCAKAEGGQILTTELVRILQKRSDHVFRSVGELELKGLPEPVDGYEVGWEPASVAQSTIAMPGRLTGEPLVAYVGRAAELDRVLAMAKAALGGERRVALVAGEPGIGKTRLATEVARIAHGDGATVLYGRCDEDVSVPYQPFVEALGHLVAGASDDLLAEHVAEHGGELATLVPALRRRVPSLPEPQRSDPETERYLLFGAVAGMLGAASEVAPVLVVLDDLHWADKQSIVLLRHLIQSSTPMAMLVIGTYRDTDLAEGDAMVDALADLRRESSVERVPLEGLGDDDVVAFLEDLAGHTLEDDAVALAHLVRRETAGNPFFIGEMMRHLAESGQIVIGEDERWRAAPGITPETIGLPESVRETVGRRLRRLSVEAVRALSVASVVGREFDLATLGVVDEASEDELLDALEGSQRAALVGEVEGTPGRFHFVSTLIQQTIYEDLSATRRARMHRRVAEALEAQLGTDPGERVGELAHHWLSAVQPTDTAKAIEYSGRAGDHALKALAPHDAMRWFAAALDLEQLQGADGVERVRLLIGLGKAQRQAGVATFRDTLLEAGRMAQRAGADDLLVEAVLANNRGNFSAAGRVDDERVAMLEAALASMDDADTAERAGVVALLALETIYAGDYERRRALSDEAVAIARRLGDAATLARVLTFRHETIRIPATVDERAAVMAEARALAADAGDPWASYWATSFSAHPAAERGEMAAVDRFHVAARAIAGATGQPVLAWHSAYHDSWAALVRGDAVESERLATAALAKAEEAGEPDAFAIFGTQILCTRWHQGRLGELVELLDRAVAENPGIPAYRAAHARALIEAGDRAGAGRGLEEAFAERFAAHQIDNLWLGGMTVWGENAVDLDHTEAAVLLVGLLGGSSGQVASTGASIFGPVDHVLGGLHRVLGDLDAALVHHERAQEIARRMEAPFFVARSCVELARTLRLRAQAGDADRAADLLGEAVELAERFGCAYVLGQATTLAGG